MSSSSQASSPQATPTTTKQAGPPYAPTTWALGGLPNKSVDIPVTAVFLALFIASAVIHMTIFQVNKKRGKKFIMSALLFGFSMARVTACILRIASVSLPQNVRLAIAASIFVAAGVVILFVVNIIFTQRMIRAMHPNLGWHKLFEAGVKITIALVIILIIIVITGVVQSFYTINPHLRKIDRGLQLAGVTYFAIVSFIPIPVVLIGLLAPRSTQVDKFGTGRWRTKVRTLLLAATLLCFGASYRAATTWLTPRSNKLPIHPVMHKAAFYCVNFTIEAIVLYLYAFMRVDKRFIIPNGARGTYSTEPKLKIAEDDSRAVSIAGAGMRSTSANASKVSMPISPRSDVFGESSVKNDSSKRNSIASPVLRESTPPQTSSSFHVYTEEETFDNDVPDSVWANEKRKGEV